jgi:hypothetical protein
MRVKFIKYLFANIKKYPTFAAPISSLWNFSLQGEKLGVPDNPER